MVAPAAKSIRPAKFIRLDLPTTVEDSETAILTRLRKAWERIHTKNDAAPTDDISNLLNRWSDDEVPRDAVNALRDRAKRLCAAAGKNGPARPSEA